MMQFNPELLVSSLGTIELSITTFSVCLVL